MQEHPEVNVFAEDREASLKLITTIERMNECIFE